MLGDTDCFPEDESSQYARLRGPGFRSSTAVSVRRLGRAVAASGRDLDRGTVRFILRGGDAASGVHHIATIVLFDHEIVSRRVENAELPETQWEETRYGGEAIGVR